MNQPVNENWGKSIGYSVNLVMDYGNGRQVAITGTLPLAATKEDFDAELDKLRLATNRQQAFIILRDRESRLRAAQKMVSVIEHGLDEYQKGIDAELAQMGKSENKNHTVSKAAVEGLRQQALAYKQQKLSDLRDQRAEIEICEVIIAGVKKEIEG